MTTFFGVFFAAAFDIWPGAIDNWQETCVIKQHPLQTAVNTETVAQVLQKQTARSTVAQAFASGAARPVFSRADSTAADLDDRLYTLSRHYLGGKKFSRHTLHSRSDVHSAIVNGASYGALLHLISQMKGVLEGDVAKVLGISTRTLRRQSEHPDKPMPADLASKAWLFAETLAKAAEVFGGKDEAEAWMSKAAMGLDGQRPIDLLQTVQGAELVNDFLTRLQYGVYS